MKKSFSLAVALSTVSISAVSFAQERPSGGSGEGLTGSAGITEVIVTAQKRAERIQDVPLTVITQSAEQLAASGVVTTKDLTKIVPGLVYAQNEAIAQPAIRGVTATSTASGSENPIAMYLDGVYQPSPNGVLFDLPDIDRIEVLKGPQGTLFGRNATGGAIQIYTRDPSYEPTGKFTVSAGQYGGGAAHDSMETTVSGFFSAPLVDDRVAMSISGFYRDNEGFLTNDIDGGRFGDQHAWGVRGKLRFDPADNLKIVFAGYYSDLYDQASYSRVPFKGYSIAATLPTAVIPTQPWHVSLSRDLPQEVNLITKGASLRADLDLEAGTLSSITGYSYSRNPNYVLSEALFSTECLAAFRCIHYRYATGHEALTQEIDFVSDKFGPVSITSGLFFYRRMSATTDTIGRSGQPLTQILAFHVNAKATAYAAFAEANVDITQDLHLIVGGRYSDEKQESDASFNGAVVNTPDLSSDSFTPRVSVRYSLTDAASVYATYSEGFKSGILPQPFDPTLTVVKPEKLKSYEIGIKGATRSFAASLSAFHYDYENMQLIKFVGALGLDQNAGTSEMDGADFEVSYEATPNLRFSLGGSWIPTAKFTDYTNALFLFPSVDGAPGAPQSVTNGDAGAIGARLIRTPEFTGTLGVNWSKPMLRGKFGVDANLYHSTSVKYDVFGTVRQDPYEDLSGQIYYDTGPMRFALFGRNLLNEEVIAGAQPSTRVLAMTWAAPRQVGVSLDYTF